MMRNNFVALVLLLLAFPLLSSSQNSEIIGLPFEVNRIYPPVSITKEKLNEAQTLIDLNKNYKSSWVRQYISVEIITNYNGKLKKAKGKNDTLSQEQKDNMSKAEIGEDIVVKVKYMPENTLSHNDIQEINFTFSVEPERVAMYPGGQQALNQYLKENAINNIPDGSLKGYELVAINFTINEDGQIINAHVFESVYQTYRNEKIENLLLEAICNMPAWTPAEYSDGTRVKQKFVLTVGNMESCVTPLLSIRK